MRAKRLVLGVSAVAVTVVLAACSTNSTNSASGASGAKLAAAPSASTTVPEPTTTTPTTTPAPTTTSSPVPVTTTRPAAPKPAAQVAAPGVPCGAAAKACVSLSGRKAWLVDNGKIVYGPVSIMPGSAHYPTPAGTFHVLFKDAHYRSREFDNAPMPDAVFFYPGDAFHVGSLGVYSHGCIHLSWSSAATFFNDLSVGDEVQILR